MRESRRQHGGELVHRRRNGNLVVLHAEPAHHVARVVEAHLRGPGRRHHHAAHPLGTQRVDRDGQRQRRIDAAGQADDGAGKAVLAEVVGHAQLQRGIDLGFARRRLGHAPGQQIAVGIVDEFQGLDEGRQLMREAALSVQRKGSAVEHQFVLAAHQIGVDHRLAGGGHAVAQHLVASSLLVHVEGRGIERQHQFRSGHRGCLGGAVLPDVGADRQAAADAFQLDHAGFAACREIALLVEDFVVGQAMLAVGRRHPAVEQERRGVVALAGRLLGIADHDRQLGDARQAIQLCRAGAIEIRPHQQVFRRVAGKRQFRRQQYVGARVTSARGELQNPGGIAG